MGVVQSKPQMTTTPPSTSIASSGIFKDCHVAAIADLEEPDEFNPHNQGKKIPKGKAKSKGKAKAKAASTSPTIFARPAGHGGVSVAKSSPTSSTPVSKRPAAVDGRAEGTTKVSNICTLV